MKRVINLRLINFLLVLTISFSFLNINEKIDNSSSDVLSVATGKHNGIFNPLYARNAADIFLCDICNELLLGYDRTGEIILMGKTGETRKYNGTDYTYYGIADCSIEKKNGYVDYNFELREDVYFGDGVNLTADDVIFTMYLMADPSYTGVEQFYSLPIAGMDEYRYGISSDQNKKYTELADKIYENGRTGYNENIIEYSEEEYDLYWDCFDRAWTECIMLIADFCAENYPQLLDGFNGSRIALGMYGWSFCVINEDKILSSVSTGNSWDILNGEMPDENDFLNESLAFYDGDAELFYSKALTALTDETILERAEKMFAKNLRDKSFGEIKTDSISGIIKNGKYSLTVRMTESSVLNLYKLSFSVLPLHYYGDVDLFDYSKGSFGFTKGNLDKVKSLNDTPLGAGPYVFKNYADGIVKLESNKKYYKGTPKTDNVVLCEITSGDDVNMLLSGNIDVASVGYEDTSISAIIDSNKNGKLSGDRIFSIETQIKSYGYIGINAKRVKVGDDPSSEKSKSLRKAFATMFAVYRDIAISSFFYSSAGCRADVIEYPIPPSSWACPKPTDLGYKESFSVDTCGNSIYDSCMSDEERYAVALDTAVEFFIEAGYKYDEKSGKFTDAPDGASMKYTITIPGGGKKAHPGYIIATMASDALSTIGIELSVEDLADTGNLWDKLQNSECDMWAAARSRGADPDLYQIYHSDSIPGNGGSDYNYSFIDSKELDVLIENAASSDDNKCRKKIYAECFEMIADYGAEVPMFSARIVTAFNACAVDTRTVTGDATSFWEWHEEIECIKLK